MFFRRKMPSTLPFGEFRAPPKDMLILKVENGQFLMCSFRYVLIVVSEISFFIFY